MHTRHIGTHTLDAIIQVKWVSAHPYHSLLQLHVCLYCTANGETEADESLCKILDNSCHGDALVGRPQMPQAKKERETHTKREEERERECYH